MPQDRHRLEGRRVLLMTAISYVEDQHREISLLIRPYRLLPSNISAPLSPQLFSYAEQEVARLEFPQARARYRLFRNVFYYFLELNMELDGPQAQWRLGFRLPKVVTRAPVVPVGI